MILVFTKKNLWLSKKKCYFNIKNYACIISTHIFYTLQVSYFAFKYQLAVHICKSKYI